MQRSLTATLKYAITSDKKILLIAKMVQGKNVQDALTTLEFMPKKAAKILSKVVKSASANATHNAGEKLESLFIQKIDVGGGPKLKRVRFASRSRMHRYIKHRSFVRVVLAHKE